MATKEQRDQFADEMAARFEAFTQWAIENWPNKEAPLTSYDFADARKEIGFILGQRLREEKSSSGARTGRDQTQYVHVNPAPWP